jgi:hypothetical protein
MPINVYMCGHGAWVPKEGYVSLPAGSSITFYTHFAKLMLQDAVEEIVAGNYKGKPEAEWTQFMHIPNMTLYPEDDMTDLRDTKDALKQNPAYANGAKCYFTTASKGITLFQFFKLREAHIHKVGGYNLHWCCCRHVDMPGKQSNAAFFNGSEDLVDGIFERLDENDNTVEKIPRRPL